MKDLTKGNIYKNFVLFAIPLILSGLLSQAYNIIDTVIAGKFLGADGIAAIGSTSSFMDFISGTFWGFGTGFSIPIAYLFGAKNYNRMRTTIYSNGIVMVSAMIIVSVIAILLTEPIFAFLRIDESISEAAKIYYKIYLAGLALIVLNHTGVQVVNSLGMSSFPLKMSMLSSFLNIFGNIFSVTVLNAGIVGIACASVFSALVVDICYVIKIKKCFAELNLPKFKGPLVDFKCVKKSLKYSLPTTVQQLTMYFASFMISPLVNGISSSATAAYTVVLKIYSINSNIYQNSTKTLTTYTAQSVGAGKLKNLRKGVRVGFVQAMIFMIPVLSVCIIFAESICKMFFPSGYGGEGLSFAVLFVRCYMPLIVFNLINNLFHGFYRGIAAMKTLIFVTAVGAVSRILLSVVLTPSYGINGIYLGFSLSWVAEAVITCLIYFSGRWERRLLSEEAGNI